MEFLYPGFLYALAALSIPILIHLFNFRRYKRIVFTNVRFLKEVQEETKNQSRLKHLLILLARLLALTALVLAFTQPVIPPSVQKENKELSAVGIYVDNSFSMEGVGESGRLIDRAKLLADEIIEAHGENQQYLFLTNDFSGKHQSLVSKEDVKLFVEEVEVSSAFRSFSDVYTRFQANLSGVEGSAQLYFITDLQASNFTEELNQSDTSLSISVLPLANQIEANVYVDSVWFTDPIRKLNRTENINIRLANTSNETAEDVSVKLFLNEVQKSLSSVTVEANQKADVVLSYTLETGGGINGKVEIQDYPITYDDSYFFHYSIDTGSKVLLIHETDSIKPFEKLFGKDRFFRLTTQRIEQVNYGVLADFDFIILHGATAISTGLVNAISTYVSEGGSVAIFPGKEIDEISYADLTNRLKIPAYGNKLIQSQTVREIIFDHPIFTDVFEKIPANPNYPKVFSYYRLQSSGANSVVSLGNDNAFLTYFKVQNGQVFQFASPLFESTTNFANHALFVPTLYQMALFSKPAGFLSFSLNQNTYPVFADKLSKDEVYYLTHEKSKTEIIPEIVFLGRSKLLRTYDELKQSGHYTLTERNSKEKITALALNYDRKESALRYLTASEVLEKLESAGIKNISVLDEKPQDIIKQLQQQAEGKALWKYFVILAIIFLLAELVLIKFLPD